jgi:hypothetical protein
MRERGGFDGFIGADAGATATSPVAACIWGGLLRQYAIVLPLPAAPERTALLVTVSLPPFRRRTIHIKDRRLCGGCVGAGKIPW